MRSYSNRKMTTLSSEFEKKHFRMILFLFFGKMTHGLLHVCSLVYFTANSNALDLDFCSSIVGTGISDGSLIRDSEKRRKF